MTTTLISLPADGWEERRYQRRLWSYLQRGGKRAIEIAHRRWGKDDVALHHTAIAAHERIGSYWHCLPEYSQARKAIWTSVNPHTGRRRIDEAFPPALRASTNDNEMFIRFKNGSTWQVIGSDRYNSLVGAGVAGVVFSEWALANPSSWAYIRPMLEENDGWAVFITTPRGQNHAKSMLDMAKVNPKWFAEVSTVHDTHALTPDQLAESRAEYIALYGEDLGNAQFEQEYECSFTAAIMGAFYAREMVAVRREERIREFEPVPGYPVHRAWDLGLRDATAIWWFQVVGGQPLILDYYEASGVTAVHFAKVVKDKPYAPGVDYIPHDGRVAEWGVIDTETPRTRVESLMALGLGHPQVVARTTDADGHQAIRSTLPRCVFHRRTEMTGMACLENYRRKWDDERKTFQASALHDWSSHGAKAFQYLSQSWRAAASEVIEADPIKALTRERTIADVMAEYEAEQGDD